MNIRSTINGPTTLQDASSNVSGESEFSNVMSVTTDMIKGFKEEAYLLTIFPNLGKNKSDISGGIDASSAIAVYNNVGVLITQPKLNMTGASTSLNGMAAGIYVVRIRTKNEMVTLKLIVNE